MDISVRIAARTLTPVSRAIAEKKQTNSERRRKKVRIITAGLLPTAVIFGGRGLKGWVHRRRMSRNERYNRKLREAYKRRFLEQQAEIDKYWRENEPKDEIEPMQHCHIKGRQELQIPQTAAFPFPIYLGGVKNVPYGKQM